MRTLPPVTADEAEAAPPEPSSAQVAGAYGLMGLTVLIWSSAYPGIRVMLEVLDAATLTSIRLLIASLTLLGIGLVRGMRPVHRADLPRVAAAGLLGFSVYHLALNYGMRHVSAGQGSFISATIPIWTAVLAWRFLGERIAPRIWAGLGLGLVGVGVMSVGRGATADVSAGAALVLLSAMCGGANIVLQKGLLGRYRALDVSIQVVVVGTLPLLGLLPFGLGRLARMDLHHWLVLLYLGMIPVGVGYYLSAVALSVLPAYRNAQMLLLIPGLSAIIAWFWIGERPGVSVLIGGGLVLLGVLLGGRAFVRRKEKG